MAALFDALFRGLRSENTLPSKRGSEAEPATYPLVPKDGLATLSDIAESDKENHLDITGLSLDPKDELPIVTSPICSGEVNSSFDTTSTIDDLTVSTPGVDVSFGPQGTPYVIRRRLPLRELDPAGTRSRAPHNTPESNMYRAPPGRAAAISIRHPDGSMNEVEHVIDVALPATAWRQEQVKYVRKARLNPNFEPRKIPTLHGPLSLPYARNPSGVDAIIIEDAPPSATKHDVKKNSTIRPEPQSFTSGQALKPALPANLPQRPLIIRSPEEIISLRQVPTTKPRELGVTPLDTEPASLPASMILKSQGHFARAREQKFGAEVHTADPFDGLFDQALVSAAKQADSARGVSSAGPLAAEDSFTPSYADLKAIWAAATEHYSRKVSTGSELIQPDQSQNGSQNASFESSVSKRLSFPPGAYSTPVRIPSAITISSKADKSVNWRNKGMEMNMPGGREIPAIALTSPSAVEGNSSTMTIDSLFQKFNNLEDKAGALTADGTKSVDPAIKETSDTPMKPTKTIKPAQAARRPLSEAKPSILNSALKKAQSVGTKGTPNAGKLLKKKVEITEAPNMPVKVKGKQKAEEDCAKAA